MKPRTPGEWTRLAAYFVLAGAAITFCVVILGSAVGLPPIGLVVVVVAALACIAVPLSRFEPRATPEPSVEERTENE